MRVLPSILLLLLIFGITACQEENHILIDSTKNNSPHGFHRINETPKVEVIEPTQSKKKKKVTYNNRIDIVIDKFKLNNLKNEELDNYVKGLFTLYRKNVMDQFLQIPISRFGENKITFKTDQTFKNKFEITIKARPFEPQKHTMEKHKGWYLYKIDNDAFLGTDGTTPKTEIESIELEINEKIIPFPKEAYQDLYEPNFCKYFSQDGGAEICYIDALLSKDYEYLFLLMEGGEGAGVYEVIWIFRLGQFLTRSVNIPY